MPSQLDSFETVVSFRLFDDVRAQVLDAVKNDGRFENESHFYRSAVMKLLNEVSDGSSA